jgi:hypothetical protein
MEGLGTKIAEIPFTFEARKASCVTRTHSGRMILTCKGAFEEVLSVCSSIRLAVDVFQINEKRLDLMRGVRRFNADGYRVILVATRDISKSYRDGGAFNFQGFDTDLTVEGLLTFLDPLKDDAKSSVARLKSLELILEFLLYLLGKNPFLFLAVSQFPPIQCTSCRDTICIEQETVFQFFETISTEQLLTRPLLRAIIWVLL